MAKRIELTQGKFAIVDDADFERVSQHKWYYNEGYAVRNTKKNGKCVKICMHRVINKTPNNMLTDHANGDTLDNRKSNLRTCTVRQNSQNRKLPCNNLSGMKGLHFEKATNKWVAKIQGRVGGKNVTYIQKRFPYTEEGKLQAARWYNEMALKHFREFAKLNEV